MASLQRVRNLDCILGQSLRRDQRMDVLGGLRERDRLHWLIPKANSCDSIVVPRGQGGLADALTVLPPGPVAARRYRDLVSDANLSQADVGQAELFAQAVDRLGPYALVQLRPR